MRSLHFLSLFLAGALLFSSPSGAGELGHLARKEKIVRGSLREEPFKDMREKDPVRDSLNVETGKQSGARFAIGRLQGGLTMGPESRFKFLASRFNPDGSLVTELDLGIQWGIFRFNFAPPPKGTKTVLGAAPGVVRIKTPTGPIELYGTDVYVQVEKKDGDGATTVYVAEGAVAVTGSGETVRVEAGQWTYVFPGRPPLSPRPVDSDLWPDGGRPPDDWQLPGYPLWIDLVRRLDVPR